MADVDESWKDTNVGGIGTDEDKALRKMAAQTEAAWEGVESEAGLKIWRMDRFHVVPVETDTYGQFYQGDSYIVLDRKMDDAGVLKFTIYFWIGGSSSIDEYGTAAYKTVELDDLLDGGRQVREKEGEESEDFKALFEGGIQYLEGGVPSGFHHVVEEGYAPTLYAVRKVKGKVTEMKVPLKKSVINKCDCFVLDAQDKIYVLDGEGADGFVRSAANALGEKIEGERESAVCATHDIDDDFWSLLA